MNPVIVCTRGLVRIQVIRLFVSLCVFVCSVVVSMNNFPLECSLFVVLFFFIMFEVEIVYFLCQTPIFHCSCNNNAHVQYCQSIVCNKYIHRVK